jgi:hypothetical protein
LSVVVSHDLVTVKETRSRNRIRILSLVVLSLTYRACHGLSVLPARVFSIRGPCPRALHRRLVLSGTHAPDCAPRLSTPNRTRDQFPHIIGGTKSYVPRLSRPLRPSSSRLLSPGHVPKSPTPEASLIRHPCPSLWSHHLHNPRFVGLFVIPRTK